MIALIAQLLTPGCEEILSNIATLLPIEAPITAPPAIRADPSFR